METLGLILDEEIENATNALERKQIEITRELASNNAFRSGAMVDIMVRMFGEVTADLIGSAFHRAEAVADHLGLSVEEARQIAARRVREFVDSLGFRVRRIISASGALDHARAPDFSNAQYDAIRAGFERSAKLYQMGIFDVGKAMPGGDNIVSVNGTGNTIVAQQASSHSNQTTAIRNEHVEALAAALDEQPLKGPDRREVDKMLSDLREELSKPAAAREKGKIGRALDGISKVVGIMQAAGSEEAQSAIRAIGKMTGLSA
jgi:hypothetical protein